jgi:hypothetical protein
MCACRPMQEVSAQESSPSLHPLDNSSEERRIETRVCVDETFMDGDVNVSNVEIVRCKAGFTS